MIPFGKDLPAFVALSIISVGLGVLGISYLKFFETRKEEEEETK